MSYTAKVDGHLAAIHEAKAELDRVNEAWSSAIKELERQYGEKARAAKEEIKAQEKELKKYAKKHRREIFGDRDRVDTEHGAVIFRSDLRVKRSKGVTVQRLEELGYTDGVRVEKKVYWERLETWPDEKLIQAGTERVRKEDVSYELEGYS